MQAGENIIRFTPQKEGTINFSCWMGMVRGKFVVK
jgi:plastocyanin domain-containing protein